MAEVIRIIVERLELSALAPETDPVVLRGITLAPRDGTRIRVERRRLRRPQRRSRGGAVELARPGHGEVGSGRSGLVSSSRR